jgi:hypothetical protein
MRKMDIGSVKFEAEDGDSLRVTYDNRGEPYREGVQLSLDKASGDYGAHLFLEDREAMELRDFLNKLYPKRPDVAPVTPTDLNDLLKSAFAAGAGVNFARFLEGDDLARWEEFVPAPRSTYQRVEAALYPEKKA